jgi:hypothetical protein
MRIENAHFFDIDTLIKINSFIWIVSKSNPSIPILKISESEFNLIKKGIYKSHDSPLFISDNKYWLPQNLLNELKIKVKNHKANITELAFSMQEFMNPSVIENIDYDILLKNIIHLKNKTDDIYVICSKNNKKNYASVISKLEKELEKIGLFVKKYYYLSKTFYNRDTDYITNTKVKLLLQHLIGYKTDDNKFINEEIAKYRRVYFYDNDQKSLDMSKSINDVFHFLIKETEEDISTRIREIVNNNEHILVIGKVTSNNIEPIMYEEIAIEWTNLIKTFESFSKFT